MTNINNKLSEMDLDELTEHMTEAIYEIRRKAYYDGYGQGKFDEAMAQTEGFRRIEEKTPQERRDEIVERAKKDIQSLRESHPSQDRLIYRVNYDSLLPEIKRRNLARLPGACDAEYIENVEKRTVVALLKGINTGTLYARGIAKCAPSDCFNVHIGKAIALRRALGLDVPDEYLFAPQPTDVRVGDVLDWHTSPGESFKIIKRHSDGEHYDFADIETGAVFRNVQYRKLLDVAKITDDSREEVGE